MSRETLKADTYRGIDFSIDLTDAEEYTAGTGFEREFVLTIDGEEVATAGELETRGYDYPWVTAMRQYAEAWIDGYVTIR